MVTYVCYTLHLQATAVFKFLCSLLNFSRPTLSDGRVLSVVHSVSHAFLENKFMQTTGQILLDIT